MTSEVRESLLAALQKFMEPVARYLLRHGVTHKELSDIAKAAFVKVATQEYGKRGRPTNVSRTSVLTGLTRKEVKRIRTNIEASVGQPGPRLGKPAQVLQIWHHDDDFLDDSGQPRTLAMDDGSTSFKELARRAGGDVPPGALLTELMNAGAVERLADGRIRCVTRHFNPSGIDPYLAMRFGEVLRDVCCTLDFNSIGENDRVRRFERRVWNDQLDERYVERFHSIVREHGSNLLEFLDDWLSAHEAPSASGKARGVRSGMGIYFFVEDVVKNKKRRHPEG